MTLQYRIAPEGQVRDVDDGKRQVQVVVPWEVLDSYQTDFSRDCFDEFFAQRLPVMCWQHQRAEPIGRVVTRQPGQAAHEMVAQFSDFDAVPRSRQAFAQIRDKEIVDFSFGFDQAKSVPHPQTRGAIRFTHARMPEISPVTIGAIPGAVAVGIRAEAEVANVRGLLEAGAIDEDGANEMLRAAGLEPLPRQRVEVSDPLAEAVREALAQHGERDLVIRVGQDGTVSTGTDAPLGDAAGDGSDAPDDDVSLPLLLQAVDGALDQAESVLAGAQVDEWPTDAQTVAQLVVAAGAAIDSALEEAGIPDSDEAPDMGEMGEMAAAEGDERAAKPYGDVEYADPGYQDDKQKRYPIDTAEHVKAALGYLGQGDNAAKYSKEDLAKVKAKVHAAAKKFGIDVSSDSGKRAAEGLTVEAALALQRLNHR